MNSVTFSALLILSLFCGKSIAQSCHLRELDICAATLLIFTQNPSEDTGTERDINKQCSFIRESEECRANYTSKCTTALQREFVNFIGQGGKKVIDEFCTPGTQLREDYKRHALCLAQSRAQSKRCNKDLQAALEVLSSARWDSRVATACCAFNRFEECYEGNIRERCGEEAVVLAKKVMRMTSSRLSEIVCQTYPADSKKCVGLLPPSGQAPVGGKSNSLLSRIFAQYFGQ